MPKFKVQPDAGICLCASCDNVMLYVRKDGAKTAWCSSVGTSGLQVPLDIVQCSDYRDKRQPSKYTLEKIAWVIRHDRSGRIKGFEPPPKKQDD